MLTDVSEALDDINVDKVTLRLRTAVTNGAIINFPGDI
jgi:hypothetical protein